ncbi:MAG: 3-phosphoserine/phosphohydroxythreonine transaminase [Pseudomonadota bacterium]
MNKQTKRVFNFGAGPGVLPTEVLEIARDDLLSWHGLGYSIMEIGHRTPEFAAMATNSENDLKTLLNLPDNYQIIFMQGGATLQFSMIAMNFLKPGLTADYFNTGIWSRKAYNEAKRYGQINVVTEVPDAKPVAIPEKSQWQLDKNAAYAHLCLNETIDGVEFHDVPDTAEVPLIADVSSCFLARELNISKFGMIYAGAQKNAGCAGITMIIIRDDLLVEPIPTTPTLLSYKTQAENHSMYNTPAMFSWYISGLVFKWMLQQGGVQAMAEQNRRKAKKLYDFIDQSEFYYNSVDLNSRSNVNIPFLLRDEALNPAFLKQADAAGLVNLKGHRLVGGMRASLYNAMPETGVDALIDFMDDFARKYHGI